LKLWADLENYLLENPDWKYDVLPEIMDGKNVYDLYIIRRMSLTIASIRILKRNLTHWKPKKNVSKQKASMTTTMKLYFHSLPF